MGWLSSLLFGGHRERRGQALSSTQDAFALPTNSPLTPSFTYPPSSSLLPTHSNPPLSPLAPYPPLQVTWNRIRAWLDREYPELGDTLNYPILPDDLVQIELQLGITLPPAVRDSYLCVDGQEAESSAGCSEGLFFGLTLLPMEDVLEEWRFWREVDDDPQTGANPGLKERMQSIPPGWIRRDYSQRGWIPLIADKVGNYVGVDLNPDDEGSIGQVIVFGRDFDTKVILYPGDGPAGWAKWLTSFADELESGEGYELGRTDANESSEDELGYEGYFYDGNGRGQGDGGGDNGPGGGLRLAGEYKGWNVLEAWADQSLRKWYEAGLISSPSFEGRKGKEKDTVGLGVVDQESDVEAPVSVVVDQEQESTTTTPPNVLGNVTNTRKPARPPPTIAITKPPVPLPVDLPTPRDILFAPPSVEDGSDLELGQKHGMTEVYTENGSVLSARHLHQTTKTEFLPRSSDSIPVEDGD